MDAGSRKTILLVDDEAVIALSGKKDLEKYGYDVVTAHTGKEAVDTFRKNSGIDLVLMDIDLGKGVDGPEAATTILKERPVPVVFFSNHTEPEIVEKTESITSYGYVVKNSGITVLDASIKMAFRLFEANKRIVESEVKQKAMISGISDVISIIDAQGAVIFTSPNIERWFGWQAQELAGTDGFRMVHPDDLERIQKEFSALLEKDGSIRSVEFEYQCRDGTYKPVELTAANLVRDPVINGVLLNYRDITERRQAEENIRRIGQHYQALIEKAPDGIVLLDGAGAFKFASQAARKMFGYDASERISRDPADLTHPDDLPMVLPHLARLLEDPSYVPTLQYRFADKNGNWVWVESTFSNLLADPNVESIVINFRNITERKRVEEALRESEETMRYIVKHDTGAIAVFDCALRYIAVSDRYLRDYEVKEENIIGKHHYDVFPEMPQKWKDVHRRCLAGAVERNDDDYFERPDGSISWNRWECRPWRRVTGEIGGIIIYSEVTTERKKAEMALREREALFRRMFYQAPLGAALVSPQYRFIMVNEEFCRITGYTPEELTSRGFADITHPDDINADMAQVRRLEAGEIDHYDTDKRYVRPDGSVVWAHLNLRLVRDDGGRTLFLLPVMEDITGRKRAEDEIKSLLAEKEILLREVHHRIRNNMSTIKSLLSLQASALKDPSAGAALKDAGGRIQGMMLLYDKLYQSAGYSSVPVMNYITSLVDEIMKIFPGSRAVKIGTYIDDFELDVKILQPLGIIINELLTNIMKYAFAGRDDGQVTVRVSRKGSRVSLVVADNGAGMPESVDFENSPGFGLMLVGVLTKQLDGDLRIERENGTRIFLEFGI